MFVIELNIYNIYCLIYMFKFLPCRYVNMPGLKSGRVAHMTHFETYIVLLPLCVSNWRKGIKSEFVAT